MSDRSASAGRILPTMRDAALALLIFAAVVGLFVGGCFVADWVYQNTHLPHVATGP